MKEKTMSFESRLHDALELKDFAVLFRMEKNDPDEYKRRIDFCAQLWHDGRRFTTPPEGDFIALMTQGYDAVMFRGKDCDEAAEINALADQLIVEFRQKNVDRWLKTISRDDAQRIIDVMDSDTCFTHCEDASITHDGVAFSMREFADRWNKANGVEQSLDNIYIKPHDNDFTW